ncbi:hypothetical protein D1B32_00925 [Oceanobacillus profundus]|uniref:VOC domain-containing protein n=1 Tax=Oceanobacillus profundus TaxID=372463 RepID=A0A417YN18_9BACI|nr:hypothetical protein D1B32_00925 [Oceanobacillus profundus]
MNSSLIRVGTIYIPVMNIEHASKWYVDKLDAQVRFQDAEKAIIDLANQSFFLVKSAEGQRANFINTANTEHFSLTFEVDGIDALMELHKTLRERDVYAEEVEDRGHVGRNFVFHDLDGNKFDVWSELSPVFKEKYGIQQENVPLRLIERIDTICLPVSNVAKASTWYQDVLGFREVFSDNSYRILKIGDSNVPLTIEENRTSKALQANQVYPIFYTQHIKQVFDHLTDKNVNVTAIQDDGVNQFFNLYDPDGNLLQMCYWE